MEINIKKAYELYNTKLEFNLADVVEIFGIAKCTAVKYKKKVLQVMAEKKVMPISPHCVDVDCAFEAWGLDPAVIAKKYKKIKELEGG